MPILHRPRARFALMTAVAPLALFVPLEAHGQSSVAANTRPPVLVARLISAFSPAMWRPASLATGTIITG